VTSKDPRNPGAHLGEYATFSARGQEPGRRDCGSAMPPPAVNLAKLETRIFLIRGFSVMLDADLAGLYGVSPSALMQAVRRNAPRFPDDFMFHLTDQEVTVLKSQSVISNNRKGRGGRRSRPYAFTEQGVAMLSSVLRSDTAIQVNVEIMRAFVRLRRATQVSHELMKVINELSTRVDSHDGVISDLVEAIRRLVESPVDEKGRKIGFTANW
jgi:hypothetical protein